jgi:hypothetical protein
VQVTCRQPAGWSANNGAGFITQESVERAESQRTKAKSQYNPVQNLPERAGPAKNFTHPKGNKRKQLLNSRPKQPNKTAHNLVGCPNTTQGTYLVSFVNPHLKNWFSVFILWRIKKHATTAGRLHLCMSATGCFHRTGNTRQRESKKNQKKFGTGYLNVPTAHVGNLKSLLLWWMLTISQTVC